MKPREYQGGYVFKKPTTGHSLFKLQKVKDKERSRKKPEE